MTAILPDIAAMGGGMHTAGIYSDMTVDGPEIGTLVVVVDRAKNLPNRKTMGKQNPYCAARLGKEAKKTETDKRGGQTPKWDQELRFTVHDSPDYNNLKVSVFNDDKKTDLIGEMWVTLDNVVQPGGGKMDNWHQLNYKGKYAGEVMLELTYYDSRPDERGDRIREKMAEKKIKRRPLPTDLHTTPLPHQMENTRTAGPRAMGSRPRTASSLTSTSHSTAPPVQYPAYHPYQEEQQDYHPGFQPQHHVSMPDLPELPPSRGHRGGIYPPAPGSVVHHAASYHGRSQSHPELPHSHSAPTTVPQAHDPYGPVPVRTPRSRGYASPALQPTVEDEMEDLPPLPPSHRMRGPPPRSHSVDDYAPQQLPASHSTPNFRNSYSGPPPHAAPSPSYPRPTSSHRMQPRHTMSDPYNTVTPPRAHPLASQMHRSASPAMSGADDAYQHAYPPDGAPIIKPRAISPSPAPEPRNSLASIRHPVQTFASQNSPTAAAPPPLRSVPSRKSVSPRPSTSGSGGVPFSPDDYGNFNPNASVSSRYTHSQSTNPHSPYHIPNTPRLGSEEPEPNRPLPNPDGPITTWDGRTVDPSDHLPVHSWAPEPVKRTPEKQYGGGNYDPNRARGLAGPRQNVHSVPSSGGRIGRDVVVNIRTKGSPNPNTYDPPSPNPAGGRNRLVKRNGGPSPSPHDANGTHYPLAEIEVPNPYAPGHHRYSEGFADGRPDVGGMQPRYRSRSPAPPLQQQQQQQGRHYGDLFGGNYQDQNQYAQGSEYGSGGGYANGDYRGGSGSSNGGYGGGSQYSGGGHGRAYSEPPPDLPPKIPFDQHAYGASALEKELSRIDLGASGSSVRGTVARRSRWGR